MNEEHSQETRDTLQDEAPTEAHVQRPPAAQGQAAQPQAADPRRRLRALLDIPDSQRSDVEWDELIELEISLAPGNRIASPQGDPGRQQQARRQEPQRHAEGGRRQQAGRSPQPQPGRHPEAGGRPESTGVPKPAKRFFKKPKRPSAPKT